jgi:hypothetical protein
MSAVGIDRFAELAHARGCAPGTLLHLIEASEPFVQ